jgi:hypothetical protein
MPSWNGYRSASQSQDWGAEAELVAPSSARRSSSSLSLVREVRKTLALPINGFNPSKTLSGVDPAKAPMRQVCGASFSAGEHWNVLGLFSCGQLDFFLTTPDGLTRIVVLCP